MTCLLILKRLDRGFEPEGGDIETLAKEPSEDVS